MSPDDNRRLITALRNSAPREGTEVIETHISTVLLVGDYAYKIKKPLDLGFLDFSTLQRRHHFCEEEVRLNGRLAPDTYLDVVAITGTVAAPQLGGEGEAIEYAVRMRRFPAEGLLSQHADLLTTEMLDTIADRLARFHGEVDVAGADVGYGDPEILIEPMRHNFDQVDRLVDDAVAVERVTRLAHWTEERYQQLHGQLLKRKAEGAIRECHGDLHLGNITLVEGEVLIFDGIEFSPELRWIDTMSELAFLTMDLEERGRSDLSGRLLNRYLELTGDYGGVGVFRFYQVYRAMVRAKVSVIRLRQESVDETERRQMMVDFNTYIDLAEHYTRVQAPALVITHGLSGSGKSTQAARCIEALPAVRLRSDVERKRLAGPASAEMSDSALDGGIYTAEFSRQTYERLLELAAGVVEAGFIAIVDATFLKQGQRWPFQQLAERTAVPFIILDFDVPERELRVRIERRLQEGADPSEANLQVLAQQIATEEPLTVQEQTHALTLGEAPLNPTYLKACLNSG
ncbi:MAG: AAA family ATPase [Candidatus Sedimenticola sp. (ex Thyasira tokunagai)]